MIDPHVLSRHPKIPIQERGEKRVTDLLGAAEQLFASLGYEATTMNAIASLAGSSIGSLYQFFPNKESLGNALLLEYMNPLFNETNIQLVEVQARGCAKTTMRGE